MMKRHIGAAILMGCLIISGYPGSQAYANTSAYTDSAKSISAPIPITVSWNGSQLTLSHAPVMRNGRVLIPIRDLSTQFGAQVNWNGTSRQITIVHPDSTVEFILGSKTYVLNGKQATFDVPPTTINGVTYMPLRFFAALMNADIKWNAKSSTVEIGYEQSFHTAVVGHTAVWLDTDGKTLYYSDNFKTPVAIKNVVQELKGNWGTVSLQAEKLGESLLVTIKDNYGEPHINDQISSVIIKDGAIVARSSVLYTHNVDNEKSISTVNGNAVMLDQAVLKLVQPDGVAVSSYDLAEITGLNTVFTVEAVYNDYLLIRTHDTRMLMGIQLSTKEFVYLYKQLFTEKEQRMLEGWGPLEADYPGDQLTLLHRQGNVLTFSRQAVKAYYGGGWEALTTSYTIPQK
ncbi:copper amine oxidase N-terminal domain-containing protein [Paenibacillus sp. 2TAB19]|uniref:copper amine oxidase N-terminal domain-containing protein n=2 Tax=Bacteria TaxID=2 RepID=UPI003F95E3AA